MRAVVIEQHGGPEALLWREVADVQAGPGELVIDVAAAGVNRADVLQRKGFYPPPPGASDILGLECSGRVRAVGTDVARWRVGDEVCALLSGGGYAEAVVVHEDLVLPVPAGVSLVDAAGLVEVAATVYSNLADFAEVAGGDAVLVHGGSGGIGSFAIQWAKNLGATVFATARGDNHAALRELGADVLIDYRDEDFVAVVAEHTNGDGVNAILDVMGAAYWDKNIAALAKDGRLAIIGMQGGTKTTVDIAALLSKRVRVQAAGLRSRPLPDRAAILARLRERVWPDLAAGRIRPTIAQRLPMAQAADAHRAMETGGHVGKLLLTV